LGYIKGLTGTYVEYEALVVFFAFVALAFIRHKANIVRIFKGTENKLSFKKKAEA
jgi:glycerol-3-phosphate acyltransferase PlsY